MVQKRRSQIQRMRHDDVPATVGLVKEARNELIAETRSIRHEMSAMEKRLGARIDGVGARIDGVDARMGELDAHMGGLDARIDGVEKRLDARMGGLDARIDGVEKRLDARIDGVEKRLGARIDGVDGKVQQVLSQVHGIRVLMEEQRSENKVVLDGIKSVMDRQDRVEGEVKEFRETLRVLVKRNA